jgi:hypothetical protein
VKTIGLGVALRIVNKTDIVNRYHQFATVHRGTTEGGGVEYINLPQQPVSRNPGLKPQMAYPGLGKSLESDRKILGRSHQFLKPRIEDVAEKGIRLY